MAQKKYVSLTRLSDFLDNLKGAFATLSHKHTLSDITDYKVDTALSSTSTNPVQNKVIDAEFEAISGAMSALESDIDTKAPSSHSHDERYYTETEIDAKLATKADSNHNHDSAYDSKGAANTALASAKEYADNAATTAANAVKNDLLNGAGTAYDTLKELGDLIDDNKDAIELLNDVAAGKADASHNHGNITNDGKIGTAANKAVITTTNGVLTTGTIPIASGGTGATTAADALTNLGITATADELNALDGITATVTELNYVDGVTSNIQVQLDGKAATHTHPYAGSSTQGGAATSANKLNTNAGSATQPVYFSEGIPVATTYALNKTVPSDAKFTDTTYSEATQSVAGLLSAADKTQLDYGGIPIVTASSTDGATYTATVDGMSALTVGMTLIIVPSTASTTTSAKLNVNGLGAKTIRMPIAYNTSLTVAGPVTGWLVANKPITVQWNGTYWVTSGFSRPSAQYLYGTVPVGSGGTGATDAATARTNLEVYSKTETDTAIANASEVLVFNYSETTGAKLLEVYNAGIMCFMRMSNASTILPLIDVAVIQASTSNTYRFYFKGFKKSSIKCEAIEFYYEYIVYSTGSSQEVGWYNSSTDNTTLKGALIANQMGQDPATSQMRNSKIVSTDTNPTINGEICWTYA